MTDDEDIAILMSDEACDELLAMLKHTGDGTWHWHMAGLALRIVVEGNVLRIDKGDPNWTPPDGTPWSDSGPSGRVLN